MRSVVIAVSLIIAGCSSQPASPEVVTRNIPYEVKVPVYVKATAPGELMRPYHPTELPSFSKPSEPSAVYGLTELDWQRLQTILRVLKTRDEAWRAWADAPTGATSK